MKIAVIGCGTVGLTSISHLLYNTDFEVCLIYDPKTPALGIGESSTTYLTQNLYKGAKFSLARDGHYIDATPKLSVKYVNWREHEFHSCLLPGAYALTFDNHKLRSFCIDRFCKIWKKRFSIIEGNVSLIENSDKVVLNINQKKYKFDYIVDCSGFPKSYEDYDEIYCPVNSAIVYNKLGAPNYDFVYHTATKNGWMFRLPLSNRESWGYLYDNTITNFDTAFDDFNTHIKVGKKFNTFNFKSYKAKHFVENRIIKNGNKALFYEPIEALSGFFYEKIMFKSVEYMYNTLGIIPLHRELNDIAEDYKNIIYYLYKGGSNFDTVFWNTATNKCKKELSKSDRYKQQELYLKNMSREQIEQDYVIREFGSLVWSSWDKNFGYKNMITKNDSLEW